MDALAETSKELKYYYVKQRSLDANQKIKIERLSPNFRTQEEAESREDFLIDMGFQNTFIVLSCFRLRDGANIESLAASLYDQSSINCPI